MMQEMMEEQQNRTIGQRFTTARRLLVGLALLLGCLVFLTACPSSGPSGPQVTRVGEGGTLIGTGKVDAQRLVETLIAQGDQGMLGVTNMTYTGADISAGIFTGGWEVIGFERGIILSTGDAGAVFGQNREDRRTSDSGLPDRPGDQDLNRLATENTVDAATLEFDFRPAENTVTFRYIFASEEYNEQVGEDYNDVFAFYVNGANYALVNGEEVNVNNINLQKNRDRFRNNDLEDGGGSIKTEMDGLTTILQFQAPVQAGEINHIKMVIADVKDSVADSNVFIEAGSLETIDAPLTPTPVPIAPPPGSTTVTSPTTTLTATVPITTPASPDEGGGGFVGTGTPIPTSSATATPGVPPRPEPPGGEGTTPVLPGGAGFLGTIPWWGWMLIALGLLLLLAWLGWWLFGRGSGGQHHDGGEPPPYVPPRESPRPTPRPAPGRPVNPSGEVTHRDEHTSGTGGSGSITKD